MSDSRISRRAVGAGLAASATAALTGAVGLVPAPAAAASTYRDLSTAGPCGLWPGHTLSFQFFLPIVRGGRTRATPFRLILKTVDGSTLLTHDFQLEPGAMAE